MADETVYPAEEKQQFIADCKKIFNSDAGINVLRKLAFYCYENRITSVADNVYLTYFNEGKRAVIIHIRDMIAENGLPRQEKVIQTDTERE